ncbi:hypothetical protein NE647_26835, partial [Blautia coccoides]
FNGLEDGAPSGKFILRCTERSYDTDPEDELEFGANQRIKRREFMSKMEEGRQRERTNVTEVKKPSIGGDK